MSSSAEAIVTLRGVSREYPGGVIALSGVDPDIDRGELVAIVGPSGSGKTTMLNVMGTLDRPSAGQVVIDGFDIAELSDRELSALRAFRIGFVAQIPNSAFVDFPVRSPQFTSALKLSKQKAKCCRV